LDGEARVAIELDNGEKREIDKSELYEAINEYSPAFQYLSDWDAGAFTLTHEEYLNAPNVLYQIRAIWLREQRPGDSGGKPSH
jgi:hypothetical protein